ncbi:unnamed protein product [Lathyrus sativus]|nr:unnamed protein product [Lathyrus sativus]
MHVPGVFVSGTVNWLADDVSGCSLSITVSLDLKTELYQNLPQPYLEKGYFTLGLGVIRDCLCIFAKTDMFLNVWIMKEFGNKESWTKSHGIPYVEIPGVVHFYTKVVYISEDDQVLIDGHEWIHLNLRLAVYNAKTGTFKIPKIPNINRLEPKVFIGSLISPCS